DRLFNREVWRAEQYKQKYYYDNEVSLFIPNIYDFGFIDYLLLEISIKKRKNIQFNNITFSKISASDIASFTYCPVSYSISKSFVTPKVMSAKIGIALHAKTFLINVLNGDRDLNAEFYYKKGGFEEYVEDVKIALEADSLEFFNLIENSTLIFSGHNNSNEKNIFRGKNDKYIGQPDYIFYSKSKEYFVVEEKFINSSNKDNIVFHESHINQLTSYIYGINDFPIVYGLLVYWFYDAHFLNHGVARIKKIAIKKIVRNPLLKEKIKSVFDKINSFNNTKLMDFNIQNRNPKKCANCVYSIYCGHKTGVFEKVTIPYSIGFLKVNKVPFPKQLNESEE